jgi:L-2-hydroxyglutarate oxidase LhgO
MEKIDITIVGAGIIGLAVAKELSSPDKDILIIEKNQSFGQETSSRNSEVIHAGIYYPKNSLKAKTCLEGKALLYEFCQKNNVAHKKLGKLIVAICDNELKDLEDLFKRGRENGIEDLKLLTQEEIKKLEPEIEARKAIYSPSTGIIDSHSLMEKLLLHFKTQKGEIAYNAELTGIDKADNGFILTVQDKNEGSFKFFTRILINSAGLNSDKVAAMAGLLKDEYKLNYCKGDYFRVASKKAKFINHLVYPLPKKYGAGLGIHATLDLAGQLRLGPDDEYVDKIDYKIDETKKKIFYENVRQFLPFMELDDLSPDTSGIRPKLQGSPDDFRDFIIKDENNDGLAGFINLIGIESPGLTSALSIAKIVKELVKKYLN